MCALTTLITPCFNGEKHLKNYIKGLLSQTAINVEYIFINDGSTDKTKEIILSYEKDFINKGWHFYYIEQENCGQANAINKGLKIMTGDYFSCIDSDDILMPDYLEKMSDYLTRNKEIDMVFPESEIVKEKFLKHIAYKRRKILNLLEDNFFIDMLLKDDNLPAFSSFMIRTKTFKKLNPKMQIYDGLSGQNPQFILPIAYNGKIGYLNECLIKIVQRKNSDSNSNIKSKISNWEKIYLETIKSIPNMPDSEKKYYSNKVKERWSKALENFEKRKVIKFLGFKISFKQK